MRLSLPEADGVAGLLPQGFDSPDQAVVRQSGSIPGLWHQYRVKALSVVLGPRAPIMGSEDGKRCGDRPEPGRDLWERP